MLRTAWIALLGSGALTCAAQAECKGNVLGYWEKRPLGDTAEFSVIEEFRIERETGVLSVCGRERSWDSQFRAEDAGVRFVYARRERILSRTEGNTFVSPVWVAEFEGVKSEYRVRAETTE